MPSTGNFKQRTDSFYVWWIVLFSFTEIWSWSSPDKVWTSWGTSALKGQLDSEHICLLISCRNFLFQCLNLSTPTENERKYIKVFWIWCLPIRLGKNLLYPKKALEVKYCTQRDLHPLSVNCWDSPIFLPVLETKSAPPFLLQTSLKGSLVMKQIDNILLCNNSYFQAMELKEYFPTHR